MTKKCSKCGEVKDISLFSNDKKRYDGLQPQCKQCYSEYRKENKEKIFLVKKKYREENKEKIHEKGKIYREENADKIKQRKKEYYENNKEAVSEKGKIYRENNKDSISSRRKEWIKNNRDKKISRRHVVSLDNVRYILSLNPDNICEICGKQGNRELDKNSTNFDHSHVNGLGRGLLCNSCNINLGRSGDELDNLVYNEKFGMEFFRNARGYLLRAEDKFKEWSSMNGDI